LEGNGLAGHPGRSGDDYGCHCAWEPGRSRDPCRSYGHYAHDAARYVHDGGPNDDADHDPKPSADADHDRSRLPGRCLEMTCR